MDQETFPIEFNNEIDDIKKSENELFTLAAERLSQLAKGHKDILGAMVNLKKPAQGRETSHTNEVTVVVYMGTDHIAATEKGEQIQTVLNGALAAVEKQVYSRREQQRNY